MASGFSLDSGGLTIKSIQHVTVFTSSLSTTVSIDAVNLDYSVIVLNGARKFDEGTSSTGNIRPFYIAEFEDDSNVNLDFSNDYEGVEAVFTVIEYDEGVNVQFIRSTMSGNGLNLSIDQVDPSKSIIYYSHLGGNSTDFRQNHVNCRFTNDGSTVRFEREVSGTGKEVAAFIVEFN